MLRYGSSRLNSSLSLSLSVQPGVPAVPAMPAHRLGIFEALTARKTTKRKTTFLSHNLGVSPRLVEVNRLSLTCIDVH